MQRAWFCPALLAAAAVAAVLATIDPTGVCLHSASGPGITADEGFNTEHGVYLADRLLNADLPGFCEACGALPDHPPLGRVWIGLCHEFALLVWPPTGHSATFYTIAAARLGPALAFGGLVWLIGWSASVWYGRGAGCASAAALVLMPHLFGHAHLAALETPLNFTWCAALLFIAHRWSGERPPNWRTAFGGGVLWGLALLTKIQAVFLPIPIAIWAIIFWRKQALPALIVWGTAGLVAFYVGWPWLWAAPFERGLGYFAHATVRATVNVWYMASVIADQHVPWHYPWVMFLTAAPVGLHLLGVGGVCGGRPAWKSPREALLLAALVWPLIVFSLPCVAVYDSDRLFLFVFPLWALFIGRGVAAAICRLQPWLSARQAGLLVAVLFLLQGWGTISTAPCQLSYYNLLVGGLRGANRLGLATTYWGDSLTRDMLVSTARFAPAGSVVQVLPDLHRFQTRELMQQTPVLRERKILLLAFDRGRAITGPRYLLMFMRREYLPPDFREPPAGARELAAVRREGVLLAALYQLP